MLFEEWRLGKIVLRNRLVRSATNMRMAGPEGEVTEELLEVHRRLNAGGIGLDITGHAFISPEGKVNPGQLGVYDDFLISGLSRLAEAVHREGGKILLQLAHGGSLAREAKGERISPSPFRGARPLSSEEIPDLIEAFVKAALRAKKAGFDGVQLHAAHGYLLAAFLSPRLNRREDEYGGRQGGIRLLKEIIGGIKEACGRDFPVVVKLGPDAPKGGNDVEDIVEILRGLSEGGLDGAEISRGVAPVSEIIVEGVRPGKGEAYNLPCALEVKRGIPDLKVILVGGMRSVEVAERVLEEGIDAVAFSRPLIAEPQLPKRWEKGDHSPSKCLSCNLCFTIKEPVACRGLNP